MPLDTENSINTASPTGLPGPGLVLREKREAGGHSLEDVSRDTRITRTKLAAIESEDYAKAGSDTYVIGYIRQYAKWLGIDADGLVRGYEEAVGLDAARQQQEFVEAQVRMAHGDRRKPVPLLWLVVGLVVVWVVVALLFNGDEQREVTDQQAAVESQQEVEAPGAGETSAAEEPSAAETQAVTDTETDTPPAPVIDEADSGTTAPTDDADIASAEPIATDELSMTFSDDCWVEVRDASGDLLFAQLQQAGDNLHLSGQAPFDVLLGNARAATVYVNGRFVDSAPRPNRDTRRLHIEP